MTEEFLYYIWKYRLLSTALLKSTDGKEIRLLYPGNRNYDQGPDFSDARLQVDGILWAGNVEIHVLSSDYLKHGHTGDPLYESIILHVVYEEDVKLPGTVCLELKPLIDMDQFYRYNEIIASKEWLACGNPVSKIDPVIMRAWITRMTIERLSDRLKRVAGILDLTKNSWEETLYILLARSFGFKVNAEPFEALARKVPYLFIRKHRDQRIHIEALLFGMAGLLEQHFEDAYPRLLQNEFKAIGKKLDGKPLHSHYWKYHRMRPSNFPDLRIAQLAAVLSQEKSIFSAVIEINELDELIRMLSPLPSKYWNNHFRLGMKAMDNTGLIGGASCEGILINGIIPFLFAYGKIRKLEEYCEKAISWLEALKPEENKITRRFGFMGMRSLNASESQGLLHLEANYCSRKRCLDCMIGRKLVAS